MPMTAFIGVRISWLIVARKALLASLAALGGGAGFLRLLEQPRVLDRDHGLVGEGLEQRDLLVAEARRGCERTTSDRADAAALPHHRRRGDRAVDQLGRAQA